MTNSFRFLEKTPGFLPGVFFFLWWTLACGAQTDLAVGLFQDKDWTACRRECLRILADNPSSEVARSLLAKTKEAGCDETKRARPGSKPGEWTVFFYRRFIGPAIGNRCSLAPSCSEYFLQASRAHGLLSIPMAADRLVREPSVVLKREREIVVGRETRIADPLSDHDRWMK